MKAFRIFNSLLMLCIIGVVLALAATTTSTSSTAPVARVNAPA